MFFVYLFYAELILLPLLLIGLFVHQHTRLKALSHQLARLEAGAGSETRSAYDGAAGAR